MKFLQIHTLYSSYLDDFYAARPQLAEKSYREQLSELLADGFSVSHLFAPYLEAHGWQSELVIANCAPLQKRWMAENLSPGTRADSFYEAVLAQVERIKPDVLYLTDPITFDSRFVRAISYRPALVFGWRAAHVPAETDWSAFDLILSNFDFGLELALKHGATDREFFMPGFPSSISAAVAKEEKRHDVVFTGQVSGEHGMRREVLNHVSKSLLLNDRPFSLAYFIPGSMDGMEAGIAMRNLGPVWGMDMFRTLRRGRINLNVQIDLGKDQAGNMRLFETTGSGSFLLTDYHPNIARYFEPGRELETYRNTAELMEKIHFYLDRPEEREAIARRGQERCLAEYSMERRAAELDSIIRRRLAGKGNAASASLAEAAAPGAPESQGAPESAETLYGKARQALEREAVEEAFETLNRAKALKTPRQGLDVLRAHCFLKMGQPLGAVEALREELRYFPESGEAVRLLDELQQQIPDGACGSCGLDNPEFRELLAVIRPYTMLSEQRLYSLYTLARTACEKDLPGNFVECGVAAGGSSALLAFVIKRYSRQPRRLFSFDSFSGMPQPTELDSHQGVHAEVTGWGTGTCAAPEESLREICARLGVTELVTPVQGYFEETLPRLRDWVGMVSLLHLDGDWYSSTKAILDNLYDRLVNDALLQVDDYGYWDGCRKAIHEFETARGIRFTINGIDGTGVWFQKPDHFPVNPAIPAQLLQEFEADDPARKGVTSQMSVNERFQLYWALRNVVPQGQGVMRFVEIGSYSGASLALTHQALMRRGIRFQGMSVEPGGTPQFHEIVKLLSADVIHLPMFSHEAAKRLSTMVEPDRLPQFIFVDGDHTYSGVRQDILDFYPLLAPGGVMMFHDYLPPLNEKNRDFILNHHGDEEPGIRQAVEELMVGTYRCQEIELPLLYPSDPTQTQAQLPIIPGVFSTVRAYRKPL